MIARDPVPYQRVLDLPHHPAWYDGRKGFMWVRFDAILTEDDDHIRAGLTWDDDSEFMDNGDEKIHTCFDAKLHLEANDLVGDTLKTRRMLHVANLKFQEAAVILSHDPKQLLDSYPDIVAQLKIKAVKS